jgi:hypothetical protein
MWAATESTGTFSCPLHYRYESKHVSVEIVDRFKKTGTDISGRRTKA